LCNIIIIIIIIVVVVVLFLLKEQQWNELDRGKPKYSGKNLSQCHFVHHKPHID
jgi:hypothetical protein